MDVVGDGFFTHDSEEMVDEKKSETFILFDLFPTFRSTTPPSPAFENFVFFPSMVTQTKSIFSEIYTY